MLLGIISDIHANLPALEAVIRELRKHRPSEILHAGDIVGYNPFPNECIELIRKEGIRSIGGNHDRAALTGDVSWFNDNAAEAALWTKKTLRDESVGYLQTLKPREELRLGQRKFLMVHGSPTDDNEYVMPMEEKYWPYKDLDVDVLIMGHTHVQWSDRFGKLRVLNPGGLGQPRDGSPKAAFAILDTDTLDIKLHRIEYDINRTAKAIRIAHLPAHLADRLYDGI
jgi:putative phosphoesterase